MPKDFGDMDRLKEGLSKLNKSDPSVSVFTNAKGELILSTCGEIHLERCIKDLNDEFCPGVILEISDPIIAFRETIINKQLKNKIKKRKNEEFEEIESSSNSEEEETKESLTAKDKELMTVAELFEF